MNIADVHLLSPVYKIILYQNSKSLMQKFSNLMTNGKEPKGVEENHMHFRMAHFLKREALISPMLVVQTYPQQP